MGDVFTFGGKCLRAKQFVAFKNQNGVPGFTPPYSTRYLNVKINVDVVWHNDVGSNFPDSHVEYNISIDRLTTLTSGDPAYYIQQYVFPYFRPLDSSWDVKDDKYIHTEKFVVTPANGGDPGIYKITTTTMTLTDEYTLPQLDKDADDIIASLMGGDVAFGQVVYGYTNEHQNDPDFNPGAEIGNNLPPNAAFDFHTGSTPDPLHAVAWNIWEPAVVSASEWFGNPYTKLVSVVKMAGNYCLKTYQLDAVTQAQLSERCDSGTGTCASAFEVDPPSPVPGQNSYTLLVPNCQCGDDD